MLLCLIDTTLVQKFYVIAFSSTDQRSLLGVEVNFKKTHTYVLSTAVVHKAHKNLLALACDRNCDLAGIAYFLLLSVFTCLFDCSVYNLLTCVPCVSGII